MTPCARLAMAAAMLAAPAIGRAQALERFSAGGEVGAGTLLSSYQRDTLGYGLAVHQDLRIGYTIVDALDAHLVFGNWWFPKSDSYARVTVAGAGLRFAPHIGSLGRLFVDAHAGVGLSPSDDGSVAGLHRFTFDAGLGYELDVLPWLSLGPVVRYGQVVVPDNAVPTDPKFWSAGLGLTVRMPAPAQAPALAPVVPAAPPAPPPPVAPPAPPRDGDGDGVPDDKDACPAEAAGPHPDPDASRRGCPLRDGDGDGVFDNVDLCPGLPQGPTPDPDRLGCPDGDDDGDGVPNHQDLCPTQPKGLQPDAARPGCPVPDADGDTVPDASDACPDKPGAPSTDPKKNGCPGLVLVRAGQIQINQRVFFETGKDKLMKKSFPLLRAVGDALRATPEIRKLSVDGHTDSQGSEATNQELSRRRAESVRAWLVKNGIDEGRLEARGFGGAKPVASNKTSKGRAQNRRVEFLILDPATAPAGP